jgi:hypothetical protein
MPSMMRLASASAFRPFPKLLTECRQDNCFADRFLPCQSRRELDGVIAAQSMLPRQRLRSFHECFRDRHAHEVRPISSEPSLGVPRDVVNVWVTKRSGASRTRDRIPISDSARIGAPPAPSGIRSTPQSTMSGARGCARRDLRCASAGAHQDRSQHRRNVVTDRNRCEGCRRTVCRFLASSNDRMAGTTLGVALSRFACKLQGECRRCRRSAFARRHVHASFGETAFAGPDDRSLLEWWLAAERLACLDEAHSRSR